jgi:hypothetical protein
MPEITIELLADIVAKTECKPGWSFEIVSCDGAHTLHITIHGLDNYDPSKPFVVTHCHPIPFATYNEATWRRWIFDQCMRTMTHEIGESLRFGDEEVRPFAPMHGPGEDPYTVHEFRPEIDFLTTQNGSIRKGPI